MFSRWRWYASGEKSYSVIEENGGERPRVVDKRDLLKVLGGIALPFMLS